MSTSAASIRATSISQADLHLGVNFIPDLVRQLPVVAGSSHLMAAGKVFWRGAAVHGGLCACGLSQEPTELWWPDSPGLALAVSGVIIAIIVTDFPEAESSGSAMSLFTFSCRGGCWDCTGGGSPVGELD